MQLITAKDVCKILNISIPTLYRWRKANKFPKPIKIEKNNNGKILWIESNIEKWINDNYFVK